MSHTGWTPAGHVIVPRYRLSTSYPVAQEVNSDWRPRRVDAGLDPGGRGKDLVGKGLDTVCARLATERASLVIVYATLATVRFKK